MAETWPRDLAGPITIRPCAIRRTTPSSRTFIYLLTYLFIYDQEDDAAFLPHFGEWARWQMARAGNFDFINLAAIRAWGSESPGVECAQPNLINAININNMIHAWGSESPGVECAHPCYFGLEM